MRGLLWWNTYRRQCALPAACLSAALVWMAGKHFENAESTGLQKHFTSSATVAKERALEEKTGVEAREERTPKEIAETLRTDPRGTQREDRTSVWAFLKNGEGRKAEKETEWLLGADEALSWLRGAEQAAPEIESGLSSLALDQNLPPALREYALQHLGIWAEEHAAGMQVLETFKQVFLAEKTSSVAGIALTALFRSCFGTRETAWIQTQATSLASSRDANPSARAAALQILGQKGAPEAEPIARSFMTKEATIHEKISALQVLGRVGTSETLGWLSSFSEEREPLTAAAQRQAVQTLRARWRLAN